MMNTSTVAGHPLELANVGTTPRRSRAYGLTNTTSINATHLGVDLSEVVLNFCQMKQCGQHVCYCCLAVEPKVMCYNTVDKCRAACPTCSPKCPP